MPTGNFIRPVRKIHLVIGPSIAYVPLSQGLFALIDAEDAAWVGLHNWCAIRPSGSRTAYACRADPPGNKKVYLHRAVAHWDDLKTDHKSGNGLDNRKSNLRPATSGQNVLNRRRRCDCKSGYKGVSWHKHNHKWTARIGFKGTNTHLGYFDNIENAAAAYRAAATRIHGDFANFG